MCRYHGGLAPQVIRSAMERLRAMQPTALHTIDTLMQRDEFPSVQFQASKAVIDWTEGKAQERVAVTVAGVEVLESRIEAKRVALAVARKLIR